MEPRTRNILLAVGGAVVLVIVIAVIAANSGDDDATTTTVAQATTTTAAETTTTAAETTTTAAETTTTTEAPATTTTTEAPKVCQATLGFIGPVTGPVAFIGEVQRNWFEFAVDTWNEEFGWDVQWVELDNMFDVAQSATVAAQAIDNADIVAIVGPAGSDQVNSAGEVFEAGDTTLAFISPSSTRVGITDLFTAMFRTVPTDADQGPTTSDYLIAQGATKVFMIDDQSSYSTGLADEVEKGLTEGGVEVIRESVAQDVTDFSALVATIPDDTSFVYLPWQVAANAQILGNQMAEQGKTITIFGSDGLDSGDFTIAGSLVAAFAPDIAEIPESAPILEEFLSRYPESNTFGPPVYAAARVELEAIDRACQAGDVSRSSVLAEIRATNQSTSILGQPIKFKDNGDLDGGKFFIFVINEDGTKSLIG